MEWRKVIANGMVNPWALWAGADKLPYDIIYVKGFEESKRFQKVTNKFSTSIWAYTDMVIPLLNVRVRRYDKRGNARWKWIKRPDAETSLLLAMAIVGK